MPRLIGGSARGLDDGFRVQACNLPGGVSEAVALKGAAGFTSAKAARLLTDRHHEGYKTARPRLDDLRGREYTHRGAISHFGRAAKGLATYIQPIVGRKLWILCAPALNRDDGDRTENGCRYLALYLCPGDFL